LDCEPLPRSTITVMATALLITCRSSALEVRFKAQAQDHKAALGVTILVNTTSVLAALRAEY